MVDNIIKQVFGISLTLEELNDLNVRPDAKDELTKRICETRNALYIHEFATKMSGLSQNNLTELMYVMIEIGTLEEKCDFITEVPNLTEQNDEILLQSIFENNSGTQKKKVA